MAKRKLFIIGGCGYLGSALAKRAAKKGHNICLYDSLMYEQNVDRMFPEGCKMIIGDTRNLELLERSLKEFKPDWVFHFGELSSVYSCNHNPVFTEDNNYRASKGVIDLCEKLKLKVIYNSTSSVYGTQKENRLMKEDDPFPAPTDYYCKFKIMMEEYIKTKKAKIIVFRPATVFGLSPRFRIELLPNHFTYVALSRKMIHISGLNAYRAAIDIEELIDGYFKVIERGKWKHLIYNIGHHNMNKREFAEGIKKIVKCDIKEVPDIGDLRNLQIDCSRFNEEFNFHPKLSYKDSIKKIAKWLKSNINRIENSNFVELLNMPLDKWRQICN